MKVCRICLSTDSRLYHITSNGLRLLYYQLTGVLKLEVDLDARLPQWVCAECGLRLLSYNKLRQKSLRSHQILTNLLERVTDITEDDLDKIDREENHLKSNLSYSAIQITETHAAEIKKIFFEDRKPTLTVSKFGDVFELEDNFESELSDGSNFLSELEGISSDSSMAVKKTKKVKTIKTRSKKESNIKNSVDKVKVEENFESELSDNSDFLLDLELSSDSTTTVKNSEKSKTEKTIKTRSKKESNIKNSVDKVKVEKNFESELIDGSYFLLDLEGLSSDSSTTVKKSNKSIKTRSKKVQSKIKNSVDKSKNTLDKKITKRVTKKEVKKRLYKKKAKNASDPFDDLFNIQKLSMEERMAEFLKKKDSPKYIKAPFKCDQCYIGFTSDVTLNRHLLTHTEKWGRFECHICKRRFNRGSKHSEHMSAHRTIYSCKECKFKTGSSSMASLHRKKHRGTVYICPHCELEFVNKNSYLQHVRVKHVSQFVCEYCGFSFISANGVGLHKKLKHFVEMETKIVSTDGPTCATCSIKFVSDEALNTHLGVAHPQHPQSRKRNNDVGIVQRRHTREVCNILMVPGPKPYQCPECHKLFETKNIAKLHIANTHAPNKKFPCRVCGKEFANSGNRLRHMVIHTGLRPFLCETCGSSFKTRGEVKAHNEHVHLKVPWPRKRGTRVPRRKLTPNTQLEK